MENPAIPIQVFPGITEFRKAALRLQEPVIYSDFQSTWPARLNWSFKWFRETHGERQVPMWETVEGKSHARRKTSRTLRELIDVVEKGGIPEKEYLGNINLFYHIPQLLSDAPFPEVYRVQKFSKRDFWMSQEGKVTALHSDFAENFFAQILGKKRFDLYRPETFGPEYCDETTMYSCFNTQDYPDSKLIRLGKPRLPHKLPEYSIVLSPGDTMYLPDKWWHRVTTLEPSVSVNMWWYTAPITIRQASWWVRNWVSHRFTRQNKV